ncbi:MAG: outer membrane beta-barrel protein [Rhizomicrobium sp.]
MRITTSVLSAAALLAFTLAAAAQESGGAASGGATSSAPAAPPAEQPAPQQSYTPPPPPPEAPPPPAYVPGGWYVGLGAGWDGQNHINFNDSIGNTGNLQTSDGAIVIGSFGYRLPQLPLRFELEGGYTWHKINGLEADGTQFSASGNANLGHVLANAIYDIPIAPRWSISLGAGAGMGFADYTATAPFTGSLNKSGFMWQGIGGITYAIAPNVDLFTDYRYRDAMTETSVDVGGDLVHLHAIKDNVVLAGVRWYLQP